MLDINTLKEGDIIIALESISEDKNGSEVRITKDKEYKVILSPSYNYLSFDDDFSSIRYIKDYQLNIDRQYLFKLKENDDINIGDYVKVLIKLGNKLTNDYPNIGNIVKIIDHDKDTIKFDGFPNSFVVKDYLKIQKNTWFKKVSPPQQTETKKDETMLDPEIYAVGTVHNSIDGKHKYKIIMRNIIIDGHDELFMVVKSVSTGNIMLYYQNTGKCHNSSTGNTDLAITKKKIKGWINIYKYNLADVIDNVGVLADTKEEADKNCLNNRIACIQVEFEEGEGL